MNCLSTDDFRIVKLSQDINMHPALVSAKVAVWQEENGNTNAFPKVEDLINVSITSNDKIIWGHPGIGKTFLHEQGKDNIIDFDSVYKSRINKELGLPEGKDGWKFRNEWRKTHEEEWKQKIRQLWKEAKEEAKKTNKILLASDIILLREFSSDFDKVINMSDETFIKRAKQRNDYTEGNTEGWKLNINEVLKNVDKSKVFTTNKYLSDLFKPEDLVGKTNTQIVTGKWNKDSPKENPNTAYIFTENINSIGSSRVGGGSAVIRDNPNAIGIVTKKYYVYSEDRATSKITGGWNQDFQDTESDFELFKKVNLEQFSKIDKYKNKIFPQGFASDLAKIPTRFAEWLQTELLNRYGLITELNSNKTGLISKGVKGQSKITTNYTWSRYSDNSYEVSSQGDSRFSALSAKLKDGRTIEEAYQLDVKGYRQQGNDWRLGKGKAPIRKISKEESWQEYKALWKQYLQENPELLKDLQEKAKGKVLTDKFASTDVSQARALAELLNELGGKTIIKQGVDFVFEQNSELSNIGTQEQYSQYLDTIFPDSKVKDIVYHGTPFEFDSFKKPLDVKENIFNQHTLVKEEDNPHAIYFQFEAKPFRKGKVISAVINSKELIKKENYSGYSISYATGNRQKLEQQLDSKTFDALDITPLQGKRELLVFEPEQIHILGSKQDIEGFKKFVSKQTTHSSNINFLEEQSTGYKNRTLKNASADATIAIAVDFTSGGERLTKSSVEGQKKKYIPIDIKSKLEINSEIVNSIVDQLNEVNAKTLNIAGNGIYTMKGKYTQQQLDDYVYNLLKAVLESPNLKNKIEKIRTGGQTGLDEAGAKAGKKLGIPTMILAPKGWMFRNESGQDITDEKQFKERFGSFSEQPDLFSSNIFASNVSNDKRIQSKIVDEYFKAKEVSDIFQNVQVLQQLIKGFKGTFAESEAFISALNKLGYDINKDFTDIEAHTKPTQQFYKNYNNVTSKVNGIDRVLNDKFLKQSIITAIDLMKVSKSFFVSQTSLAKSIRDNVSSLFKPFKASKTTFKNNFRKNFLSYLTVTAYINSVKNDEDLKIPHIKDFLLTPLDKVAEGKEYNKLQSKYFQILSYNRENGIKNDFLDFLQPSKVDYDKHSSSLLYNYRLNLMEMDSRNVKDPDKIQSLISGFNQLYFANNDNIIEKNEEVKRINNLKYEFARDMFKYLIVKDGLLYQNQSFIKAIDPILFLETSHKLDEIQELFKKENPSSSEFTKLFGMTKEELELDFVLKFSLHANNYYDLKSQKLGVILTEKKDRDVLISKQKEEEKQADFAETDKIENAEYGDEENIDEELVQEDNYPLYWHNVDKSLTVNLFAGQTTNMSTQEKKQNKAENKRYILSKENEIFKKIREPFKTPDGQIKHYDVIGLPVTTYVNDKKDDTADRIPLKLAIVQNTIKIGTSFLTFQFTPEGKAVRVDSRTMTKLRNMGVMFTDLQNNSIFDIINDSAKLKLQTNKENIPNLIKIAKELSNFYRGGYIIGTRAKYEKTIIVGSSKLSSFGDDLQSQMDIKMSEEEQGKVTLSMYNRKDKTIKDEDKRDILIAEINKYSTNTITKESAKNIGTPNLEEALKRFIRTSSSNLTEKQIEDKIKECFKTK